MSSYWVNFAATGDPNGPGLPVWPRFNENEGNTVMVLGETIAAGAGPDKAGLDIYDKHYRAALPTAPGTR
jgi:para-nitrobenzyl esterase